MNLYEKVGAKIISAALMGAAYGTIDYLVDKAFDKFNKKEIEKEKNKNIINIKEKEYRIVDNKKIIG